jgi:hypothetical protein
MTQIQYTGFAVAIMLASGPLSLANPSPAPAHDLAESSPEEQSCSVSPEEAVNQTLHQSALTTGLSPDITNCDQPPVVPLKNSSSPECQLVMAWGHGADSRHYIKTVRRKSSGIGMGCNSGKGGIRIPATYFRYQRGPNGNWAAASYQGTQNAGLSPLILSDTSLANPELIKKNSYIGFMRMMQYHWLQLHSYAQDELLSSSCSDVSIELYCTDDTKGNPNGSQQGDLHDRELKARLESWQKPIRATDLPEPMRSEAEILNRFEPLRNCFGASSGFDGSPSQCGSKITITRGRPMARHCIEWTQRIERFPQQNEDAPKELPRIELEAYFRPPYSYPRRGEMY